MLILLYPAIAQSHHSAMASTQNPAAAGHVASPQPTSCAVCHTAAAAMIECRQCRNITYCSSECEEKNRYFHRKLCWKFKHSRHEQPNDVRVFWFPQNEAKPKFSFVDKTNWLVDAHQKQLIESDGGKLVAITVKTNPFSGRPLNGWLEVVFNKWTGQEFQNRSIPHLFDLQGLPKVRIP